MAARFTRLVALSQAVFFGLLLVCICLHPGYLFARNEGGISNFGVHAATVGPFTVALGGSAALLLAAGRALPRTPSGGRRLAAVLAAFAATLVCVLATTYPYQHGPVLHDLHVATGIVTISFEAAATAWLLTAFRRGALEVVAGAAELVGVVLSACTLAGSLHVLFVSQLVTAGAFGALLVAACATLDERLRLPRPDRSSPRHAPEVR